MKKFVNKMNSDFLATAAGLVVAIATAFITIDWANFDISKEYPKLICSAVIAAGGYFSKMKKVE